MFSVAARRLFNAAGARRNRPVTVAKASPMITGTCYFPTRLAAVRYYAEQEASVLDADLAVSAKMLAEEIFIGKPPARLIPPGGRLTLIDGGLRYGIEEPNGY